MLTLGILETTNFLEDTFECVDVCACVCVCRYTLVVYFYFLFNKLAYCVLVPTVSQVVF